MKQKIFLGIGLIILTVFGISIYNEFMANHTYYNGMFATWDNRKFIIWALMSAGIPLAYMYFTKQFSIKNFLLKWLPAGLVIFSVAHTAIKDSILGSTGFIILCINTLLIYALGMYFIIGSLSLGTRVSEKRIKFTHTRRQELLINFGIGLGIFLLLIKILIICNLLFGWVSRIIFLGLGVIIYIQKTSLKKYTTIINNMFTHFQKENLQKDPIQWIGFILVGISIIYYLYGFQLSFIPYSTAWDANHEYMYIPKIFAANHGSLRGNVGPGNGAPSLRHAFITFRFSLAGSLKKFWIGPDTIAVAMNFLSGVLVMILGIGTIKQIIDFFTPEGSTEENKSISFYLGRFLLLLWLTSGMGAFLVFVDNKTDLGVMTITTLAILSGFIFLDYIKNHSTGINLQKDVLKYVISSGAFFALASMTKVTAFIDIALFGLVMIALRFSNIIALGLGVMIAGITGVLKVANAPDLLTPLSGKWVIAIGAIITIYGITQLILKKQTKTYSTKFKYLGIRAIALLSMLLVFKGPQILYSQIHDNSFSLGNFGKTLLLGKNNTTTLLATTETGSTLTAQTTVDQTIEAQVTPAQCKTLNYTKEELEKTVRKAVEGNEDVGRYVGYGRKEIDKTAGLNIGYGLIRLFTLKDNTCYGLNPNAKLLCKNSTAIDNFDVAKLETIFQQINPKSKAYEVVSGALGAFYKKGYTSSSNYNPTEFRDQIVSMRQYYQSHAIKTETGKIYIPYRFIIPLNISFNRSLQNLSSYYTDIGFIWLFAMAFIILGLIYGIIKRENTLITVSGISLMGWAIWWIIGGGILWYGMGLIVWTILATVIYILHIINDKEEKNQNLIYIFLFLFAIWGILQLGFNLIRISSQGAGGPFARYKMSIGKTYEVDENLQQQEVIKNGYSRKDVFDLQFPHYNKFIDYVANRKDTDGVLIAGTYIQYFIKNQWNIMSDGMLSQFRKMNSDNNGCKASKRLEQNNVKYLVVDPNIGTVGMGEGNESLFQRFFAKLDPITGKIKEDGAMSMLVRRVQEGYLKLFNTNNLGAKYAFTLSDAEINAGFGGNLSAEDLIFTRTKLAIARYFADSTNYVNFVASTFIARIQNGNALGDIADVYGKTIDEAKLTTLAKQYTSGQIDQTKLQENIKTLSQDERIILAQYLGIYNLAKADQTQLQTMVNNVLGQSLGGSSQLMIFERL